MGKYAKSFINNGSVSCEGMLGDFLDKIFKTHSEFTDPDVKLWKRAREAYKAIQSANYNDEMNFTTKKLLINPTPEQLTAWLADGEVVGRWSKEVLGETEKLFNLLHDIEQNGWSDDKPDQELAKLGIEPFNSADVIKVFKSIKIPPNPLTRSLTLKSGLRITDFSDRPPFCKVSLPDTAVSSVNLTCKDLKITCSKLKQIVDDFYTGSDGYSANGQQEKILSYTDTEKMILRLKNVKFKPEDERMVRDTLLTVCRELGIACHIDNEVGAKLEASVDEFLCSVADTLRSKHV